ncbi:hypothetical protein Drorol1_Dr00011423, partial [Drosera rotundifolia]
CRGASLSRGAAHMPGSNATGRGKKLRRAATRLSSCWIKVGERTLFHLGRGAVGPKQQGRGARLLGLGLGARHLGPGRGTNQQAGQRSFSLHVEDKAACRGATILATLAYVSSLLC